VTPGGFDDGLDFGAGIPPPEATPTPPSQAPSPIHTPDDDLDFAGYPQPPDVPPDPTGEDWRGQPGEDGPPGQPGPQGPQGVQGDPGAILSATAPTANLGALWWDTVGGQLYVRYNDPNSTAWVAASSAAPGSAGGGGTPSDALPAMDGTAAPGVLALYSRGDHVHPTDTSRYAAANPSGYQTAAQVTTSLAPYALTSAVPVASSTTPLMDNVAAIGAGTTWARADHVHPVDTSRYAANNPAGYVTAAAAAAAAPVQSVATRTGAVTLTHTDITDWTATLAPYAPLASPAFTGTPSLPTGTTGITQTAGNSTTAVATTAFVATAISTIPPSGTTQAYVDAADALRVLKAGDTMTNQLQITAPANASSVGQNLLLNGSVSPTIRFHDGTNPAFGMLYYAGNLWMCGFSTPAGTGENDICFFSTAAIEFRKNLSMANNRIRLLGAPQSADEAANRGYVDAAVPVASSTTPGMDAAAAIGVGTTWARADHIHPTDTSRYAASNPSGYQTAAQVTAAVSALLTIAATPPAVVHGNLWWDSTGGQLYIGFNDGNSTQWVAASSTPH